MVFNLAELLPGFSSVDGFPEALIAPAPIAELYYAVLADLIAMNPTNQRLTFVTLLGIQPVVMLDSLQVLAAELYRKDRALNYIAAVCD